MSGQSQRYFGMKQKRNEVFYAKDLAELIKLKFLFLKGLGTYWVDIITAGKIIRT